MCNVSVCFLCCFFMCASSFHIEKFLSIWEILIKKHEKFENNIKIKYLSFC